ncbi:sigma 54-interacting transcriptional regulator [Heyndrickxia faecalis]|jgi:transcriptional regulator with PAS, ATPase and Fis domain|uniref:sigma 54-interacting transcriptional regulator n=1 Tax=Heyndrickxia TaxID=2837504 RepID=UPI000D72E521|nr:MULTISPECIES: sigma 54-interacting transcriptional regulator [Heyndrickxia]AWP36821.1 Fis family transcriptional regulator [Heyndrickxia coagulans]MBQ4910883.1 sigma 54-interacting transcriptional regulator [Heyndrickxia faecalis]MEC2223148.1 sigma 54-interacting transcriptional regulator [Weizmannia sp. CD-2023]MEC2304654.1 sigma 54-interacting transcriptional regulator [Weizmannia sp. CD-2023]MEC2339769.1 sigma 54-interacting transcriptional regulator [Weizmannia sp. CD-2023]
MPAIAKEKIKPIIPFSVDGEEDLRLALQKHKGPFLFLKKDGELFAYALLNHQLLEKLKKGNFSKETLLRHAKPLDGISRLDDHISITSLFQIIGEPFALVRSEDGRPSGYIQREDMLAELFKQENESAHFLKILLASIPMGIFVLNREKRIIHCNEAGLRMIKLPHEAVLNAPGKSIFSHDHIAKAFETGKTYLNHLEFANGVGVLADYSPIQNFAGEVEGLIIVVQDLPMVEEMALEIEYIKDLNKDLNAILSTIYDEILVVNAKGELLRYGENIIEDFWQVDVKTLIGKNILDFEDQGLFTPSVIRLVMEKRKKVSVVQETRTGRKILAVGNPVFNEKGALDRIIIASRDITETTRLKTELKEMKEISARYKKELDQFKNKDRFLKKMIYCSPKMEKIMHQVKKIAEFSSTVLLSGESGVGKEVIAQAIHQFGKRSEKPFLKLNCGAIPETLLESELFGYVKGAFTGAEKNGKEGYFKQADGGILFLDEIGELPVHLQVKLLRVLQEQEVIPIGSTTPIKIDVQIITATNQNLAKMVEEGRFREDLYYRLNVIPIRIPPLRERPEDISLLAFHFLQQLNEKYGRKFYLTPDAINVLECYPWPGNVRELQNIIERLVVTADHAAIDGGFVSQFLTFGSERKKMKPVVTRIMPLQEAMESVEEQLILQAMNQYKTTTKAAKALGISQSSVSRKYQKILNKKNRKTEDPVFK